MTESEIISQSQRHNKEAQHLLFENNFNTLMSLSMRYAKDQAQAKEILNNGFVYILNKLSEFNKSAISFDQWMKEQFIENTIRFLKNKKTEYYITTTVKVTDSKAGTDLFNTLEEFDASKIDGKELMYAIQQLPPSFRAVYNMCMVDGFDFKKASDFLEVSEDTARFSLEKAGYHLHQNIRQLQKGYR